MLRILNKALINERNWLRSERLGAIDRKYAEGARMAKERIPQLEQAIKIIINQPTTTNEQPTPQPPKKKIIHSQLSIFN